MTLIVSKTVVIPFRPRSAHLDTLRSSFTSLGVRLLNSSDFTKLLGIYVGPTPSSSYQFDQLLTHFINLHYLGAGGHVSFAAAYSNPYYHPTHSMACWFHNTLYRWPTSSTTTYHSQFRAKQDYYRSSNDYHTRTAQHIMAFRITLSWWPQPTSCYRHPSKYPSIHTYTSTSTNSSFSKASSSLVLSYPSTFLHQFTERRDWPGHTLNSNSPPSNSILPNGAISRLLVSTLHVSGAKFFYLLFTHNNELLLNTSVNLSGSTNFSAMVPNESH